MMFRGVDMFMRRFGLGQELMVMVARLTQSLGETPVGSVWGDTHVVQARLSDSSVSGYNSC